MDTDIRFSLDAKETQAAMALLRDFAHLGKNTMFMRKLSIRVNHDRCKLTLRVAALGTAQVVLPSKGAHSVSACVPFAAFLAAVSAHDQGVLTFSCRQGLRLTVGRTMSDIRGVRDDEAPLVVNQPKAVDPTPRTCTVPLADLVRGLKVAMPSTSHDPTKSTINHPLLHVTGEVGRIVGTDGFFLTVAQFPVLPSDTVAGPCRVMIPRGLAIFLQGLDPDDVPSEAQFRFRGPRLEVSFGNATFTVDNVSTGKPFPAYEKVYDTDIPHRASCDRQAFLDAMRFISIKLDDYHQRVQLQAMHGALRIHCLHPDRGEAWVDMPCEGGQDPFAVACLGHRLLVAAETCCTDQLAFHHDANTDRILLTAPPHDTGFTWSTLMMATQVMGKE